MFDKHYIGLDLTGFENNGQLDKVSRITLLVDDENAVTAGDDTGLELTSDCPHATQAMAEALLASLKGYQYKMYGADDANIDPAAELGDGATAGGTYSVISSIEDDGSGYVGLAAPGEAEEQDEFPSAGPITKEFRRKLADVRSSITKTADQILLKVEDELNGLSASIDVQLGSITNQVNGLGDAVSTVSQTANKINWLVASGTSESDFTMTDRAASLVADKIDLTGFVTFRNLSTAGETIIDAGNITTGKISTEHIHLGGEMNLYSGAEPTVTNYYGSFGAYQGMIYDANGNPQYTNGVGIRYSSARGQVNCTSGGVWCGCGSASGISAYPNGVTIKGNTIRFEGTVDGLSVDSVSGNYTTVYGSRDVSITSGGSVNITSGYDDVALSSSDGTIAVRLDWANDRIKFWVDGTTWYLDADGLHR